jgi:LPXTG-motif cell wall-anchored protein
MNARNTVFATATCTIAAGILLLGTPLSASAGDNFTIGTPAPVIVDFAPAPIPEPKPELPLAPAPQPEPQPDLPISDAPDEEPEPDLPISDAPDEEPEPDLPISDAPEEDPELPDDKQGPNQGGGSDDGEGDGTVDAGDLAHTGAESTLGLALAGLLALGGVTMLAVTRRRERASE